VPFNNLFGFPLDTQFSPRCKLDRGVTAGNILVGLFLVHLTSLF
jgi:hypothetical protein